MLLFLLGLTNIPFLNMNDCDLGRKLSVSLPSLPEVGRWGNQTGQTLVWRKQRPQYFSPLFLPYEPVLTRALCYLEYAIAFPQTLADLA